MNAQFRIEDEDKGKAVLIERETSGEDGEDDYYTLSIENSDYSFFEFDNEAQVKDFLTKFSVLVSGLDFEQVTKRIQRLEAENARLRAEIQEYQERDKDRRNTAWEESEKE